MLLAINVNNTNVKFAVFDGKIELGQWRVSTNQARTSDEYAVWLTHLMALKNITPSNITNIIVGIVVPQVLFEIKELCRTYFNCDPWIIGEYDPCRELKTMINHPDEAGADRIINAIAGHELYHGPLIIVDFGTATTFDVVDEHGNYLGGVIAPGINLSVEALHITAAKLPQIAIERPKSVIGTSTVEAMKSGVYWGYVGLIEGLITKIKEEYKNNDTKVIVTGGLAPLFINATNIFDDIDTNLTMKGLLTIYRRKMGTP